LLGEISLLYIGVIAVLKGLYGSRDVFGKYLSTLVAVVLIYTPLFHVGIRKIQITFFEKDLSSLVRSLFYFTATSLVIFPLFLTAGHFYQKIFFARGPDFSAWNFSFEMVVVQLFLVALPEEFFFRGYLQTLIAARFPQKIRVGGFSLGRSVLITSFFFALAHSLIAFQWWHFAIFFPSLVFGGLRERTNGLVAPILFHAASNLAVAWIGAVYRY